MERQQRTDVRVLAAPIVEPVTTGVPMCSPQSLAGNGSKFSILVFSVNPCEYIFIISKYLRKENLHSCHFSFLKWKVEIKILKFQDLYMGFMVKRVTEKVCLIHINT